MSYCYRIYGIDFSSEIEFNELAAPESHDFQAQLTLADLPQDLPWRNGQRWFDGDERRFWFRVRGAGEFLIEDGCRITVQPDLTADMALIRLFVTGSAFAALMHQRGALVLHGAVLTDGKTTALFTGASGKGKSTMAAMLWKRGYSVVAEDVAVMYESEGEWQVWPGYPFMRICPDMLPALDLNIEPTELTRIFTHSEKYLLNLQEGFHKCPARLDKMVILDTNDASEFSAESVQGNMGRFAAIANNTYRANFLRTQGMLEQHFRQCAGLSAQIDIIKMFRPEVESDIFKACDFAEKIVWGN